MPIQAQPSEAQSPSDSHSATALAVSTRPEQYEPHSPAWQVAPRGQSWLFEHSNSKKRSRWRSKEGYPSLWCANSSSIGTVASWSEGTGRQTKYVSKSLPSEVTITRRHHPALGKTFAVVRGGSNQLVIRLDDDSTMRVPRSWTDADGVCATAAAPEHVFTADALRELGALVASLLRRCSSKVEPSTTLINAAAHTVCGRDS